MIRFSRGMAAGLATMALAASLAAQETAPVQPVSTSGNARALEAEIMGRTVSLNLQNVTLREALTTVASDANISLVYSRQEVPVDHIVSLMANRMTVGDVLDVLLRNTGIEAVVSESGRVRLRHKRGTDGLLATVQQGSATISGLVTDSGTGAIITQAVVHVDGTQITVRTNATGHYTISGLAAGEYRVTARHVGYLSKTRVVTLTDSGAKTVDFLLNEPATTLNEVVTTATGDQRRYQVGNVISTINVDSIAPNAPVTSVTDLITGRAPGVEVVESSGLVGGGEDIRIRGVNSMLLQSDPIIIMDGIRVDNTAGGNTVFGPGASPYRLNDIDFSQIESIDILKGPAATTEYGTDGANGVIIITTKRGMSGRPRWSASAMQSASTVPETYSAITWNWGHSTDGISAALTNANGYGSTCWVTLPRGQSATAPDLEQGACVVDSITAFNPLDHAATTVYGTGPASKYNVDVGGGSEALRYYFAGGVQDQTGNYKLPDVFRADALALGLSNSVLRPNTEQQGNWRANTMIRVSSVVNVQVSTALMSTYADFPATNGLNIGGGPAVNDSLLDYGYGALGFNTQNPAYASPLGQVIGNNSSQATERWEGSATVDWRPVSWFTGNVAAGIDHEAQTTMQEYLPQIALLASNFTDTAGGGALSEGSTRNDLYTVTLRGSATATLWHHWQLITNIGASYVDTRNSYEYLGAEGLSASDFTLANVPISFGNAAAQGVKSGGTYVEEQLSYGDRCYAPLGIRFDVGSAYGANVSGTQNPNLSVTCTILTGRTSLRLRGAYGISDEQPPFGANVGVYQTQTGQAAADPTATPAFIFQSPGNQQVRPERDQQFEGGFDLGLWNERLQVSFTVYNTRNHDLLYTQALGWELQGAYTENVGNLRNEGMEATVTGGILQTRPVSLSVTMNASVNHNKLLTLAHDLLSTQLGVYQEFAAGYPLYGYWGDSVTYRDATSDGVLENTEIHFGQTLTYQGSSTPIEEVSVMPSVGFWRNMVMINALFDYQGDFKVIETSCVGNNGNALCDGGGNGLREPLRTQALTYTFGQANNVTGYSDMFLNGTYAALRELSIAVSLPQGWARAARLHNLSLVGAVRNLALWTHYPFGDPEVGNPYGEANNSLQTNNDLRSQTWGDVPLTRQWTVRLNAGF